MLKARVYIWVMIEGCPEKLWGQGSDMIAWCPGTLNDPSGRRCGTDGGEQGWGVKIRNVVAQEGMLRAGERWGSWLERMPPELHSTWGPTRPDCLPGCHGNTRRVWKSLPWHPQFPRIQLKTKREAEGPSHSPNR